MDPEEALNAVTEFLPDFIAWAENPNHVLAPALCKRGRERIEETYMADLDVDEMEGGLAKAEAQMLAGEVTLAIGACAEWIVEDRRNQGRS